MRYRNYPWNCALRYKESASPKSKEVSQKTAAAAATHFEPSAKNGVYFVVDDRKVKSSLMLRTDVKDNANNKIIGRLVGKVNGHTINADVPAGAKFTDTVTTVTITGSGNAVTEISASNGALTATKDATFATKQESSNHVIASKTQPSNQQAGDIWIIIK